MAELKKGQAVKVVKNNSFHDFEIGEIVYFTGIPELFEFSSTKGGTYLMEPSEFEILPKESKDFIVEKLDNGDFSITYTKPFTYNKPDEKENTPSELIQKVLNNLGDLLQYKNTKYGSSGLVPLNIFSKDDSTTGILQRIDDKLARVKNNKELMKNDVADLVGYLVLLCVSKGWIEFNEFKD